jgi:hypothetical protein
MPRTLAPNPRQLEINVALSESARLCNNFVTEQRL